MRHGVCYSWRSYERQLLNGYELKVSRLDVHPYRFGLFTVVSAFGGSFLLGRLVGVACRAYVRRDW